MVPTRGDEYYNFEFFQSSLESLLDEQTQGRSYFYLIKDTNASVIGRVNLVDVEEPLGIGHLGYRVDQLHTGKGIANIAVKLVVEKVLSEGRVKQIKAKTTTNNIASQRVLEKNGFEYVGRSNEVFEMNDQKLKFVYYSWAVLSKYS